ncbi:MAG: molybdate ABC transporter substrate-binding protein [Gammaproteobacteria bacterium]
MANIAHRLAIAALIAVLASACGNSKPVVTVLAASSLQDVVPLILADANLTDVRVSYAASSTLARQIEAGAPADIFLSASTDWVDRLAQSERIVASSREQFLGNRLVLVAHPDALSTTSTLNMPADLPLALGADARLAIGDPAHVPAGRYAKAALNQIGVWSALESRCALADNVRAALALVARGEAPFGVVYATDAALEPGLRVVADLSAETSGNVAYAFALVNRPRPQATDTVYRALTGSMARERFRAAGFLLP